jgi:hypothetical protein
MTTKQLKETYSHLNYIDYKADGEEVKKNFVTTWIKDENNRKYDTIDFLPILSDDNYENEKNNF